MLELSVTLAEDFDETTKRFVVAKSFDLQLEHSLASLSKWESREQKPFLGKDTKTSEELLRYIQDMTLTPDVSPDFYLNLSSENFEQINAYINAAMTATTFREIQERNFNREIVTAEIMYYWMVTLSIPFECQHWHLNRLITLVRVCNEKNKPAKKQRMTKGAAANRGEINRQRMAAHNTRG